MKLQRSLLAVALATVMLFAHAAPDKATRDKSVATASSEAPDDAISKADSREDAVGDMLLQAVSLLGVAYRFGGSTPTSGLDCSGFIQYVFKKSLQVNLPRTAQEMARVGRSVSKSELQPGDLVFFNTRGFAYSHVGLYLGNGKFIHSPRTGKNIEMAQLAQSYWVAHFNGARRINRTNVSSAADTSEDENLGRSVAAKPAAAPACAKGAKGRACRAAAAREKPAAGKTKAAKGTKGTKADKPAKSKKKARH